MPKPIDTSMCLGLGIERPENVALPPGCEVAHKQGEDSDIVTEIEEMAWKVLQFLDRLQAEGSLVRVVVPRAWEVAQGLGFDDPDSGADVAHRGGPWLGEGSAAPTALALRLRARAKRMRQQTDNPSHLAGLKAIK